MNSHIFILYIILFSIVSAVSIENSLRQDIMYILIGEEIFPINLVQSPINMELISILPLKTKVIQEDYSKINMRLNAQIETANLVPTLNTSIDGKKGDLFLYQGKELILLNASSTIINDAGDYVKIGSYKNSEELMNKIERNKTILLWNTLNYENHEGKVRPYGNYNSVLNYFTWKIFTFFCFLLI